MQHWQAVFQTLLILCSACLALPSVAQDKPPSAPSTGTLHVVVVGFQSTDGEVKMALANSKANYTGQSTSFRGAAAAIEGKSATAVFDNLPYGEYAVRVYHDANGNDKLDTNAMGAPKEPYGFSNNVRGLFGPAKWAKAKFTLNVPQMTVEIRVK